MDDDREQWKPAVGFEGLYEVSNHGGVRRSSDGRGTYAGRVLRQSPNGSGYHTVCLHDGTGFTRLVQRLVADAFLGPIPAGLHVNHLNGCKTDNASCNLEIVTQRQNELHAVGLGRKPEKLTEVQAQEILAAKGSEGSRGVAKRYGVHHETVCKIWRRERWKALGS